MRCLRLYDNVWKTFWSLDREGILHFIDGERVTATACKPCYIINGCNCIFAHNFTTNLNDVSHTLAVHIFSICWRNDLLREGELQ